MRLSVLWDLIFQIRDNLMHDFSISQQIASKVIEEINRERAFKVIEIKIKIGELTHLNPEQIDFWLKQFFHDTPAEDAKILIEKTPPLIYCKGCGYRGTIKVRDDFFIYPFIPLNCPKCGLNKIEIKGGNECLLEKIKIKR